MSVQQARLLRKGATDPEKRLWSHLRNREIGNLEFRRQHPFGNRVVDFFCEEAKLATELDGSGHLAGRRQTSDLDREIELYEKAFEIFVSTTTIS
jgi:very-short-patch-repair endonuclease